MIVQNNYIFGKKNIIPFDRWYNINISSDGITPKLHVNGIEVPLFSTSVVGNYSRMSPRAAPLRFQCHAFIDEFSFFRNRQLTNSEIDFIFNNNEGRTYFDLASEGMTNLLTNYTNFNNNLTNLVSGANGAVYSTASISNGKVNQGISISQTGVVVTPSNTDTNICTSISDIPFNFNVWLKPTIIYSTNNLAFKGVGAYNANQFEYLFFYTPTNIVVRFYSQGSSSNYKDFIFNYQLNIV